MSRLSVLLRQIEQKDSQLAADLAREVKALSQRRQFGLNFERHVPETVALYGRPVRKGDKVRPLAPRDQPDEAVNTSLWKVVEIVRRNGQRFARLLSIDPSTARPELVERAVEDLVVIAEFRDPIYPGLISTGKVERGANKPYHVVINAENFHALQLLLYTHEGTVDAIYIDPPYNTGARDWKYNNAYVDADDLYRHSKWLAFMERRLKLAKRLLNPEESVLIVTIDDKEVHRLGLLLQQLFPECSIQMITSLINPQGISSGAGEFSRVHEFLCFVGIGRASLTKWSRSMIDNDKEASDVSQDRGVRWADFARYGANAGRKYSPGAFYPLFIDVKTETIHSVGDALTWDEEPQRVVPPKGTRAVWPPKRPDGSDGRWRVTAESCRVLVAKGYIKVGPYNPRSQRHSLAYLQDGAIAKIETGEIEVTGRDAKGAVTVEYAANTKTATPKTIWTLPSHDASRHGSNLLRQFLPGRSFPYPKSLYAVEDALRFYLSDKPDAVVVDFFAGSGTTAHAVMRLNRQDGGCRYSICVTNNEVSAAEQSGLRARGLRPSDPEWEAHGICEWITKPRITAAVEGLTPEGGPVKGDYKFVDEFPMSEGFEENVEFFTMTYEAPRAVAHNRTFEAIAPVLWLKAGATGSRIEKVADDYAIADSYAILFDPDCSRDFIGALQGADTLRTVFIVTDDDRAFQMVCAELPKGTDTVRLYSSYLTNFTINRGGE